MDIVYQISGIIEMIEGNKAFVFFESLNLTRSVNINVFEGRILQLGDVINLTLYKNAKPALIYGGNIITTLSEEVLDELDTAYKLLTGTVDD